MDAQNYYCEVCERWCGSQINFSNHLRGQDHRRKYNNKYPPPPSTLPSVAVEMSDLSDDDDDDFYLPRAKVIPPRPQGSSVSLQAAKASQVPASKSTPHQSHLQKSPTPTPQPTLKQLITRQVTPSSQKLIPPQVPSSKTSSLPQIDAASQSLSKSVPLDHQLLPQPTNTTPTRPLKLIIRLRSPPPLQTSATAQQQQPIAQQQHEEVATNTLSSHQQQHQQLIQKPVTLPKIHHQSATQKLASPQKPEQQLTNPIQTHTKQTATQQHVPIQTPISPQAKQPRTLPKPPLSQEDTIVSKEVKTYKCEECEKIYRDKRSLKRHIKTHHNQRPSIAKMPTEHITSSAAKDPKAFSSSVQLTTPPLQQGTSMNHPSIQCPFCIKSVHRQRDLKRHILAFHTTFKCEVCSKTFNTNRSFRAHQRLHKNKYECSECGKEFLYSTLLKRHVKKMHPKKSIPSKEIIYKCRKCKKSFNDYSLLKAHVLAKHNSNHTPTKISEKVKKRVSCFNCNKVFRNRIACNKHLRNDCIHLPLKDKTQQLRESIKNFNVTFSSALRGCMSSYQFDPINEIANEKLCLEYLEDDIVEMLKSYNSTHTMVKWSYYMDARFQRMKVGSFLNPQEEEETYEYKDAGFSSLEHAFDNIDPSTLSDQYDSMRNDIINRVEKYTQQGSGWVLMKVNYFKLKLFRFCLKKGGNPVTIPDILKARRAVINIDSDNCFKWSVLCSLHHNEVDTKNRANSYTQWENDFDFPSTAITSASQVAEFVNKTKLAIFTHVYSGSKSECTYRPPRRFIIESKAPIHLLLYKEHWMPITNLSALYRTNSAATFRMCSSCLASFYNKERYDSHLPCVPKDYIQTEIMPEDPLEFKDFNKCVDLADIVYADMEAILEKCEEGSKLKQKHVPCCVGSYWCSKAEDDHGKYKEFKGPNCIKDFVDKIEDLATYIFERNKVKTHEVATKSAEEMRRHELATECMWCKIHFNDDADSLDRKVFDHCHLTGKYRGPACQRCNNKLRQDRKKLIVAFHNFRGYDSHGLCLKGFSRKPNWVLRPIAQNSEKYLSLSATLKIEGKDNWMQVRFIDTLQIINCSLSRLAENLLKGSNNYKLLPHSMVLKEKYPALKEQDIAAKGIFPYSYVNNWEKLEERTLPPYEEFYDELEERISTTPEEYAKAQEMFKAFQCKTLFDYQLRYMELDCRLLADVFETFRRLTKVEDGLDAAHFLTVSQLSYASALKKCNTKIELIAIPEMYRDVERCKRGGYAFVNKHYCEASNPYVNQDKMIHTKEDVYLGDIDANNLYGNALRYPLPVKDFKYLEEDEYKDIDWHTVQLDGDIGYFVVCDLHYPEDIHNKTKDFPLALEVMEITEDMLPDYFKTVNSKKNLNRNPNTNNPDKYKPTRKLLATCYDKKEYVVHFTALQLYINYGLQITKIHRVISFYQTPVFRNYIDYNSNRRKESANEFEKDFYKQKNNSLFGKSLENKRDRCDYHLCNNPKSLLKATSQHRFITAVEFNENLVAAQMTKANIELNAPIAIGAAILDISKTIMYKIAYDNFSKYERLFDCKLNIVGGDTDSIFFEAVGVDLQGVLYPKMFEDGLLDTSNYDITNPIFSNDFKAKLGCIKDEFAGKPCKEFVLLRPKSYSMKTFDKDLDKKKSKGVPRRKIKAFQHDDFRRVLLEQTEISTNCRRMQSISHTVYNIEQHKIALSYADDKRAWFSNNFSLPYGHFEVEYYNKHPPNDIAILLPTPHLPIPTTHAPSITKRTATTAGLDDEDWFDTYLSQMPPSPSTTTTTALWPHNDDDDDGWFHDYLSQLPIDACLPTTATQSLPPPAHAPTTATETQPPPTDVLVPSKPVKKQTFTLPNHPSHNNTAEEQIDDDDVWIAANTIYQCAPHKSDVPCSSRCKRHSIVNDNLTIKRARYNQ